MFNIKEYLNSIIVHRPLSCEDRFALIGVHGVSKSVKKYLEITLKDLSIVLPGVDSNDILDLMKTRLLEGQCYQTAETSIVFFNDNDYLLRGYLMFDEETKYYHSWICFNFQGREYIFDPCLDILCESKYFNDIFEVTILSRISALETRKAFIEIAKSRSNKDRINAYNLVKDVFNICFSDYNNLFCSSLDYDINSIFYANNLVYDISIVDNKIRKLKAFYYKNLD